MNPPNIIAYRYPAAYTFQVLGFSIIRWIAFSNPSLGKIQSPDMASLAAASFFFRFIYRLGGFFNVVLILTTRPNILLFGSRGVLPHSDPRREREELGGADAKSEPPESQTSQAYRGSYMSSPLAQPQSLRTTEFSWDGRRS